MSTILISDVPDVVLAQLRQRAAEHNRSPEAEAKAILQDELAKPATPNWAAINELRQRLAASGRSFGDSAELIREDRER
jgi:plasmid stability protein